MSNKKSSDKKLGDMIYDLRMSKNFSQEHVATAANVSRQTVSKWESNRSQPKSQNLMELCKALNVDMSYFDSKPTDDATAETTDKSTTLKSEVVCDEATGGEGAQKVKFNEVEDAFVQAKPSRQKRKLSQKTKIAIVSVVLVIAILVGIAMIIFAQYKAMGNNKGNFAPKEVSTTWNFNIENLGWTIFGVAIAVAVILGIILICKIKVEKNKIKKWQ